MRNFVHPGVMVTLLAAAAVSSGDGVVVGGIFGVAATDAAVGEEFEAATSGVYEFPKVAGVAVEQGGPAYFNAATGEVTDVSAAGLYLIGSITEAAAAGAATARVRLDGKRVVAV